MDLKGYIKTLSKDEFEDFAKRCGTSVGQLKQIAGSFRPCRESLAINIERESGRKVLCESLRPDVDWKVLRGTDESVGLVASP